MKILIQSFNYYPQELGGSERSSRDLATGFKARGHEVRVVLSDGSFPRPNVVDGIPIDIVEGLPIGKSPLHKGRKFHQRVAWNLRSEIDPVLYLRCLKYLEDSDADVIVSNNMVGHGSAMMAAAQKKGIPFVPIIRDYGFCCAFGTMMHGGRSCEDPLSPCHIFSTFRRGHLRKMPKIIAISKYVETLLHDILGTCKTQVIYNSVPDVFLETPRPDKPDSGPVLTFGYLGRLHPTKGVNELIDAWRRSELYTKGHRFLLAGDNQGIDEPGDTKDIGVEFLGAQPAIEFLDRLDVMFLPALWAEPFGRTVIEATARGVFVIGSPNGGIPELITPQTGMVLPKVDVGSLTQCLLELSANPAPVHALRQLDARPALAQFRSESMLDQYEQMLEEVVSGNTA